MKELRLDCGRRVSIAQLHQAPTYAGVLAGKMGPYLNQLVIDSLVEEAEGYSVPGIEPLLVAPSAEAFANKLPAIACIAVLESGELKNGHEPYSAMTVAWFQDELAPPFPNDVEALIRGMDWEAVAKEWCP
jgi:hypothetical protein